MHMIAVAIIICYMLNVLSRVVSVMYSWCYSIKLPVPNDVVRLNAISWVDTMSLPTAVIEYLTILLEYINLFQLSQGAYQTFRVGWEHGLPFAIPTVDHHI